jgi:hypothetical protein
MNALAALLEIALTPAVWVVLLLWWAWRRFDTRFRTVILRKFDKATAMPGQLFSDGNPTTSKTELLVRTALSRYGFPLARQGTAVWTPPDHRGMPHKYTPDIVIPTQKLIVEVDPQYTHGGDAKIATDLLRNQQYARIGYRVVRLRMGGAKALSENDVVIEASDYTDDVTPALARACRKARWLPPETWESDRKLFEGNAEFARHEKSLKSKLRLELESQASENGGNTTVC